MAGMKGLVANPAGQIIELAIKSSYKEGLSVLEYFIATHGSRKGAADTALRTATAGYLTRRLIDVAHEVIVKEEACKDQKGIMISRKEAETTNQELSFKGFGRVCSEDIISANDGSKKEIVIAKKGDVIDGEKARLIEKHNIQEVHVFSPISCATRFGICRRCYGWDLGHNTLVEIGSAAGIIAAQAIGEPGTQLTMRTFHTGGVAGGADITQGLPRVNEVFEMQPPPLKAVLSTVDGVVISIEDMPKGGKFIHVAPAKEVNDEAREEKKTKSGSGAKEQKISQSVDFEIPPATGLLVEEGSSVTKGQSLCEGNLDFKEYFRIMGREKTQRMIAQEIQKIYVNQGANIHDKHIEVIARQMCSRVRITENGDSKFTVGEVIESSLFFEENDRVKKAGKNPARAATIILGISKVALTTDSFLSAASFQETSRVLIRAALEGKHDELRGLKENVILGKLIPVGTGFRREGSKK
jgi:DNA-directed RNA polymerase subunit beta'